MRPEVTHRWLCLLLLGTAVTYFVHLSRDFSAKRSPRYKVSARHTSTAARLKLSLIAASSHKQKNTYTGNLVELHNCADINATSPIYAQWGPLQTTTSAHHTDPLDAIFEFGVLTKPHQKMAVTSEKVHEKQAFIVPNIHHYAWYSHKSKTTKRDMRFHHYVSILSAQKFNKPQCVYFWYEIEPTGKLWELLKMKIRNLIMVRRQGPESIYGNRINVPEHKSDVVRLEALLKYGGIYTDLDVIVLKPFTDLRNHAVTMGYESSGTARNWLCNGIMVAKPNATFMRIWYRKYSTFRDKEWGQHSVYLPAKLAKLYPNLIHTELDTMNRPNWEELPLLYKEGKLWDWSRSYAVHLWYRLHNKDHNMDDIKVMNTTMAQLFRYIVYGRKNVIEKNDKVMPYAL